MTINKDIELPKKADLKINVAKVFNIDTKLSVKGFKDKSSALSYEYKLKNDRPRRLLLIDIYEKKKY